MSNIDHQNVVLICTGKNLLFRFDFQFLLAQLFTCKIVNDDFPSILDIYALSSRYRCLFEITLSLHFVSYWMSKIHRYNFTFCFLRVKLCSHCD